MENVVFVYMTFGQREEAERIGAAIVEDRLAACVNVLPGMTSMYWWEGRMQKESEVVLIAKTRRSLFPALKEKVLSLHSYDCPCIVAWPLAEGHQPFLDWIGEQTRDS